MKDTNLVASWDFSDTSLMIFSTRLDTAPLIEQTVGDDNDGSKDVEFIDVGGECGLWNYAPAPSYTPAPSYAPTPAYAPAL